MDYALFTAILLGVVEGLTEFLPVSSTGHLILLVDLLGFQGPPGRVFEIVIQLGAILAVCLLYHRKLLSVAAGLHPKSPNHSAAKKFITVVLLGFLPAMLLGAVFHEYIKSVLFNPVVVCYALIIGGLALLALEKILNRPYIHSVDDIPAHTGFKIGVVQCLAMVPGVSRSGATIMGGLLLGLDRRTAAEFSFFLAMPTMAGAVAYDLYKNWAQLSLDGWVLIAAGFIAAFLSALLVVRWILALVERFGFAPFAYYRIILGGYMLYLLQ